MSGPIDWTELSRKVGQNKLPPIAFAAIEQIVGEGAIRDAVDYYVAWKQEREIVRSILWAIRPWSAMQRCYEIIRSTDDREDRRAAVELLRVAADERALDWIDEFLADPDDWIQEGAINILDQMLFGGGIRYNEPAMEKVDRLLASAETHPNPNVRQGAVSLCPRRPTEKARRPMAASACSGSERRKAAR